MAAALRNVLARMKSGADVPALGGTMVEGSPLGATAFETPVGGKGTVVESGPLPPSPGGTFVETGPLPTGPQRTLAESAPLPGAGGTGSYGGGTSLESPAARPMPPPPAPPSKASPKLFGLGLPVIGIGGIGLICLLAGGVFLISRLMGGGGTATPTEQVPVVPIVNTAVETATETLQPTAEIVTPSVTPTETLIPTATVPPGPYVRINSITIDSENRYVVEYETFEYTEVLPGMHVHFYFNTVSHENAGVPGSGPWYLYGGPRPFTKYRVSDRPPAATQMCALVANPNHSIELNSGNCVDLPGL